MRRWLSIALVPVVLGALLVLAPPASAAGASSYTASPASGPAGTTISVASTSPCSAPPAGKTLSEVDLSITNALLTLSAGEAKATLNPDRSWSGTVSVKASARNGLYRVVASCWTSDGTLVDIYIGHDFIVTSASGQADPAVRFAGNDRIATAISISQDLYPETDPPVEPDAVVLARSDSYADALAGTPLARTLDAPLLLTGHDSLDSRTASEITRLIGSTGDVYVLGGSAAISDAVVASLTTTGYTVTRLAGVNRYDTAARVASTIGSPGTVLLANGLDFHDGLVAGAAAVDADPTNGAAVLLTSGTTMPTETKAYLDAHPSLIRYAVGSSAAAADPTATPIVGSDFADTSRKVAEKFFAAPPSVAIASQAGFADALSGGVHASAYGGPLLFTDPSALPSTVNTYLSGNKASIVVAYVYGGTAAVSDAVRSAVVTDIT